MLAAITKFSILTDSLKTVTPFQNLLSYKCDKSFYLCVGGPLLSLYLLILFFQMISF